ncbi:outer membrane receptor protein involved in Fe transport [Povalibacter uvarum]|uniref:Outer membrane receptor protein involved in Fe transport n=1 Tax=Povalibacter uvarum TaxID=732238 RepID=A0A841HQI0_9GAMM|nr:TonB-dependent receptor [Povalibacter uvarum]MBB6094165.1 outer membrane receptor protein involved in Fe transport [Povalibacter uvarum]
MSINSPIRRAVRCALLSGTATLSSLALPALAADDTIQEIVVTGSRIAAPNMTSISPVTAMSADDIVSSGKVRVEDIINQLPQAMAAQGSMISNGSTGTATVDLRGLNAKRTLVLINGRRLMPGNPDSAPGANSGAPDLNQIPRSLIERVEVLTGGASSVYGADAVAGVVNFIMNTRFEGVKLEANYSFYNHENDNPVADIVSAKGYQLPESSVNTGYSKDFSFVMGSNFADDRGNATFYATYREVDPVLQGDYDFSACTFNSGDAFTCGGSSTTSPTRMQVRNPLTGSLANNVILDPNAAGGLRPYSSATDAYNFGPLNFYQRPDERYTAGVFMDMDVADNQNVYGEFMFMKDRSVAQIAPSGIFNQEFTVPCNHPYFTPAEQQVFCGQYGLSTAPASTDTVNIRIGKRNIEGGPRQSDIGHEAYRVVLGLRGDINDTWSYDVYGQYGQTELSAVATNDFSVTRIGRSLNAVRDGNGNVVCQSVLDGSDPACVPYNPFQLTGITQDQIDYLQIPLVQKGTTTERVVNASVTGDFSNSIKLPTAQSGLMVNFGVEWREELSELLPDAALQSGDGAGQGGPTTPVDGGYIAKDLFAEARMALIEDKPLAHSLSAEAGYRYSDYSLDFTTDTYKLGLEWSPIEDIRARASYQRSVRVPNVTELYGVQAVGLQGSIDLCATDVSDGEAPGLSFEECARTGVTAANYGNIQENPAAQYNGFIGGNPDLQPETADTLSFGLAFQPSFIPGLRLQVDYFDIAIEDAIQNPNADFTLLMCARTGDPATCARVQRDADGSLWQSNNGFIVDTFENIGEISTSGIDFDVSYQFDVGNSGGRLAFDFVGTLLESLEFTPQTGVTYDCAGLYGTICGVPAPEWRHKFDTTWRMPWGGVDLTLSWRYYDAVSRDAEDSNEFLSFLGQVEGVLPTDSTLGSRSYIDLTGSVTVADRYTFRLGVNNLFDKDPPLNGSSSCPTGPCNGNTWPQVYDSLGRQIFGLVTIDF